jgi:phage minor structural protein
MIPILYGENETNFTSNGLGRLSDAISCHVIEERNGQFTLEMVYPISGKHYADIKHSRYIYAVPSDGEGPQPFRIYKTSKPLSGKVTIWAEHRSYQLSMIPCEPFTAANVAQALQGLKNHSLETNPFTFWTDKTTVASYNQETPASIRSRLGGVQGSILDVYGGEFKFDNTTVRLYANRGADRGVVLNYGKNIVDINQEENIEQCVTGCCPYWKDETSMVMLPEKVVYSTNANLYPYHRTEVVDFSSYFQEKPTEAQLRARAESYINGQGIPKVSIKVSFVALWQTEEYKNIANLERVKLCDTITVHFEKLGIDAQAKVIKTDYDVLKDRYDSIEIGEARSSLTSQVVSLFEEVEDKPSSDWMQQSIARATELITGGLGGYVILKPNANGQPEEILIMDNADATQAVNVIRMNQNGIGFSTTGYNGPFTTAWTIDGHFIADWIDSGTLRSITITGTHIDSNTITASAISGGSISGTTITGSTINGDTITGGTITGATITNGNNIAITNDGFLTARQADIKNIDANENYVALNPNLPQMDMVSRHITDEEGVTKPYYQAAIDYNGYRIIHNHFNLMSGTWGPGFVSQYNADGFSLNGAIVGEIHYDAANQETFARLKSNNLYPVAGGTIELFNAPDDNSWTYRLAFQSDGNLVIYNRAGQVAWQTGIPTV